MIAPEALFPAFTAANNSLVLENLACFSHQDNSIATNSRYFHDIIPKAIIPVANINRAITKTVDLLLLILSGHEPRVALDRQGSCVRRHAGDLHIFNSSGLTGYGAYQLAAVNLRQAVQSPSYSIVVKIPWPDPFFKSKGFNVVKRPAFVGKVVRRRVAKTVQDLAVMPACQARITE